MRNDSLRRLRLSAARVRVLDSSGNPLRASVAFTRSYVKPLEPQNRPNVAPEDEQERLGRLARLDPDEHAPLVVTWVGGTAERIDYGGGSLPVGH